MEPDAWTDLERVGEPIGRDLPVAGHVTDDVGVTVGIDLQERAVERGDRLESGEGVFLVSVEAWRVGGDRRQQHPTPAWGLRGADRSADRHGERTDQENAGEDSETSTVISDPSRHPRPPEDS